MGQRKIEAPLLSLVYLSRNSGSSFSICLIGQTFEVPHAIDAMHVQKNVFESLIATLMDTGKTKDGLKSQKYMVQLNVKVELHLVPEGNGKYNVPAASFKLTPEERRAICTFLMGSKFQLGFHRT
jgi:hypothetical protein